MGYLKTAVEQPLDTKEHGMRKSYGWLLAITALLGVALFFEFLALPAVAQPANADLLKIIISPDPPVDEDDGGFSGNPIDFFDNYSWRLFVALNWPAQAEGRGLPDRT